MLEREDPYDAFISTQYSSFKELPEGATIGTSSSRRQACVAYERPDLNIVPFRGNVNTRLKKLSEGIVDATFLAIAGLNRLNLQEHITERMNTRTMLPAVAQGAIGIECRADDATILPILSKINHMPTFTAVSAERAVLATMEGDCHTPLCGHATLTDEGLHLQAMLFKPDGSNAWLAEASGPLSEALEIGHQVGHTLKRNSNG